ncbi:hypothetical protein ACF0H5_014299 [Mactra antiquata]
MDLDCTRQLRNKFGGCTAVGILCIGSFTLLSYAFVLASHRLNSTVYINPAKISNGGNVVYDITNGHLIKNRTKITQPPPGTQMGQQQIDKILSVLPRNGNLLVWGLGNDSPFWHDSTDGKVAFIEESGTPWFAKITSKYPFLNALEVKYSTHLVQSLERYSHYRSLWHELNVSDQLPASVKDTAWDVIIVDAPAGFKPGNAGRYQSIFTSAFLAEVGTHIFVDDYERKVEYEMSNQILGTPVEVTRRPMTFINSNVQAHFIVTEECKRNILNV